MNEQTEITIKSVTKMIPKPEDGEFAFGVVVDFKIHRLHGSYTLEGFDLTTSHEILKKKIRNELSYIGSQLFIDYQREEWTTI